MLFRSKITKTTPVAQAQGLIVGNRLTKTPKNKISLAAQYDWEIFGSDAFARIDYSWQLSMLHTPLNQVKTFEPSYAVTNARVGYTIPKSDVRVAVYVHNLIDKNYALNRSYVAFADYTTPNFDPHSESAVQLAV